MTGGEQASKVDREYPFDKKYIAEKRNRTWRTV